VRSPALRRWWPTSLALRARANENPRQSGFDGIVLVHVIVMTTSWEGRADSHGGRKRRPAHRGGRDQGDRSLTDTAGGCGHPTRPAATLRCGAAHLYDSGVAVRPATGPYEVRCWTTDEPWSLCGTPNRGQPQTR